MNKRKKKNKSRAARKRRVHEGGLEAVVDNIFRDADAALTKRFTHERESLRTMRQRVLQQIENHFWLEPAFMKKCRDEVKNFTQEALAAETGISLLTIVNYETGTSVLDPDNAYLIYKTIGAHGSVNALRAQVEIGYLRVLVAIQLDACEQESIKLRQEYRTALAKINEDHSAEIRDAKNLIEKHALEEAAAKVQREKEGGK
jgi:transcriptional regulator with XRE-family HTH domain